MLTTTRTALISALTLTLAASAADAQPRVVVLGFDGPHSLADAGWKAVAAACKDYEIVPASRWKTEAAVAARDFHGPALWSRTARQTGVDVVIDGYITGEGKTKQLVVLVHDAASGRTDDNDLTVKLTGDNIAAAAEAQLEQGLVARIDAIGEHAKTTPAYEIVASAERVPVKPSPTRKTYIGAKDRARTAEPVEETEDKPEKQAPTVDLGITVQGPTCSDPLGCDRKPEVVAKAVAKDLGAQRFRFSGGPFVNSRSLTFTADPESIEDISQYAGVGGKGFQLTGELYPFPIAKTGGLTGIGFSLQVYQSMGSTVGIDDDETVGDYSVNQNGFIAAVHWRQPLGATTTLDTEVGYSQDNYTIEDAPEGYEVPDTAYRAVHAGAHLDLAVGPRSTIGFGGRYFYVLGQGDLTSTEFFGPGETSGYSLDAHFQVPLPSKLFIRGELEYKKLTTQFTGGGLITDDEDVFDSTDSIVTGAVSLGITF